MVVCLLEARIVKQMKTAIAKQQLWTRPLLGSGSVAGHAHNNRRAVGSGMCYAVCTDTV
jgi:hypothetical protein